MGQSEELPARESDRGSPNRWAVERAGRDARDRVRVRRLAELTGEVNPTAEHERRAIVAAVYVDHQHWVEAAVRRRGCDEDVAQEVFFKFHRDVAQRDLVDLLTGGLPVGAALATNVHHLCSQWWRELERRPRPVDPPPGGREGDQEERLHQAELQALFETFERSLKPVDLLVWHLTARHGIGNQDVGRLVSGFLDGRYHDPSSVESAFRQFGHSFFDARDTVDRHRTDVERVTWTTGAVEQRAFRLRDKFRTFVGDGEQRNG